MPPAREDSAARYGSSRRERAVSFVLATLTSVLLFIILVTMSGLQQFGGDRGGQLVAINIAGPAAEKEKAKAAPTKDTKTPVTQQVVTQPPKLPPRVVVPSKNQVEWPPGFIHMSHDELAKADISKIKPSGGGGAANGAAGGGGNAEGTGDGPGGARLYNAEWYREPSDAELSTYLRAANAGTSGQWAMIACRTVERFHVEDCRELEENPRGSGLARALRQAAWQFLVRPPRVDGKPQIGAWVRIRFDFKHGKREDPAAGGEG
jgi:protein TonB